MPHDTGNEVSAGEMAMEISVDCDYRLSRRRKRTEPSTNE
jgi:hypothetical protein